jgi:hypothetical protein
MYSMGLSYNYALIEVCGARAYSLTPGMARVGYVLIITVFMSPLWPRRVCFDCAANAFHHWVASLLNLARGGRVHFFLGCHSRACVFHGSLAGLLPGRDHIHGVLRVQHGVQDPRLQLLPSHAQPPLGRHQPPLLRPVCLAYHIKFWPFVMLAPPTPPPARAWLASNGYGRPGQLASLLTLPCWWGCFLSARPCAAMMCTIRVGVRYSNSITSYFGPQGCVAADACADHQLPQHYAS